VSASPSQALINIYKWYLEYTPRGERRSTPDYLLYHIKEDQLLRVPSLRLKKYSYLNLLTVILNEILAPSIAGLLLYIPRALQRDALELLLNDPHELLMVVHPPVHVNPTRILHFLEKRRHLPLGQLLVVLVQPIQGQPQVLPSIRLHQNTGLEVVKFRVRIHLQGVILVLEYALPRLQSTLEHDVQNQVGFVAHRTGLEHHRLLVVLKL